MTQQGKNLRNERGSIMVISMAVVVVLASLVLIFAQEMRMEAQAAANRCAMLQANAVARGALAHIANQLGSSIDLTTLDAAMQTQGASVGDGFFWIVRPNALDETQYDFGLVDEASKLNLNTATYDMLMRLPNMSSDLAAAIIDWRDVDEDINSNGGAENEYYLLLEDPYYCKNANFETLEELLLVKGATRDLLYGVDANHNGIVDSSEQNTPSTSNSGGLTGLNGNARCGIMKYLTVYSQSPNTSASGSGRTNVNTAANDALEKLLSKAGMTKARIATAVQKLRGAKPFKSTFDFYFKMGLKIDEFKKIADSITTDPRKLIPGLINVNTAPKEVLNCLPGLDPGDGDTLYTARSSSSDTTTTTWVLSALTQTKALAVAPYICANSSRFSAELVGVSGDGRAFKRARCVFDAAATAKAASSSGSTGSSSAGSTGSSASSSTGSNSSSSSTTAPTLLFYRDDSILGWPLDPAILDDIRAGRYAGDANTPGSAGGLNSSSFGK